MSNILKNKKIALLVADGFEQSELEKPLQALREAGAEALIVSPVEGSVVRGWKDKNWGDTFHIDKKLSAIDADQFDGLVLPGGVMNPDTLRQDKSALEFVKAFFKAGKPVAAICHGPWTLIDAGVVDGRKLTSYASIKNDLINAGAQWVDEEVVVNDGLITSRKPSDIPAFNAKMIEEFAGGIHTKQKQLQTEARL